MSGGFTPGPVEHPAIAHLREHQRQLDADGCEVGVSRQALDETLAILDNVTTALKIAIQLAEQIQHGDATPFVGAKLIADHSRAALSPTQSPATEEGNPQ